MGFLKGIFTSKKLGAAVGGIITIVLSQVVGLDAAFTDKIVGILMLQGSLAVLVGVALWSVFAGNQAQNYAGSAEAEFEDEDWD